MIVRGPVSNIERIKDLPTKVLVTAYKERVRVYLGTADIFYIGYDYQLIPKDPCDFVYEHTRYVIPRADLKKILDNRENVLNKQQRKQLRQQRAKDKKSR